MRIIGDAVIVGVGLVIGITGKGEALLLEALQALVAGGADLAFARHAFGLGLWFAVDVCCRGARLFAGTVGERGGGEKEGEKIQGENEAKEESAASVQRREERAREKLWWRTNPTARRAFFEAFDKFELFRQFGSGLLADIDGGDAIIPTKALRVALAFVWALAHSKAGGMYIEEAVT